MFEFDFGSLDRTGIAEVYAVLEWDWNVNGIVWERPSNRRRNMSTGVQLARINFDPALNLCYGNLDEVQKCLYHELEQKWGLV